MKVEWAPPPVWLIQYRELGTSVGMKRHSRKLTWILSSFVHMRPGRPLRVCPASLAHELFQGATFKLHFKLICRYFWHSKHYASFRNGQWRSQDELFLQISTEVRDPGLGCGRTYQRTSYHTHLVPSRRSRPRQGHSASWQDLIEPNRRRRWNVVLTFSAPLSHGLLFFAPLLLLFSSSPLRLNCMAWPKPIKIALLERVDREREREGDRGLRKTTTNIHFLVLLSFFTQQLRCKFIPSFKPPR